MAVTALPVVGALSLWGLSLWAAGATPVAASAEPLASSAPTAQEGRSGARPRARGRRPARGGSSGRPAASGGQRGGQPARGGSGGGFTLGGEDLAAPFGMPAERQQRIWFSTADADATEWISFREARASMRFDAERYRIYDTDNDGRMTFEEYQAFIKKERSLGREVTPPVEGRPDGPPPIRDAEQLRAAYDTDLDGSLSRLEIDRLLLDYDRAAETFDAGVVTQRLDSDGDGLLGIRELERLANYLTPLGGPGGTTSAPVQPGARNINELFGQPIDMGENNAPRIVGPVSPFRRLDVDNDGYVTLEDLERLEGRTFSAVSLKSVLNTLDIDTDGRLSKAEFLASMK